MGPDGSQRADRACSTASRAEAPILLVEHDMDAVFALADRISVLVYGRVIATGTVDEIRDDPEVRTAYLGDEARMTLLEARGRRGLLRREPGAVRRRPRRRARARSWR